MPLTRSWLVRARRTLASHVDRLHETLVTLTDRVRETVAQAVSNNLASAIREAVHALFSDSEPSRAPPNYHEPSPYRQRPAWGEPDPSDREEYDSDLPAEDWSHEPARGWREVACAQPEPTPFTGEPQQRVRWNGALAVGCQAAAWWLRRQAARASAVAAVGIGVLATGAAFVAGIGLAESALHLLSLADAVRSGTHALASLA
jgi:hypothetical protein